MSQQEGKLRIERHAKEAIALAMQGQWKEAVIANRAIIEISPEDIEAHNRLGRALMETGEYAAAREAYEHALELDPYNNIAKKNLDRLSYPREPVPKDNPHKVLVDIFVEEVGKARLVSLVHPAPKEVVAQMAPGDEVSLQVEEQRLLVRDRHGEYLGEAAARYGPRLAKLIRGGNKYIAAINSLGENEIKVTIREVYQHPSQAGRLSFPLKEKESFRPYVRESLLRHRLEEDELEEQIDEMSEVGREGFTVADFDENQITDEEEKL